MTAHQAQDKTTMVETGKLLWVSPTTIRVSRLVPVDQSPPTPYHQPCSCGLCRTSRSGNETLVASHPEVDS